MSRVGARIAVASVFAALLLVAVPAPAAAHDPGWFFSMHLGPAKVHLQCDEKEGGDKSDCFTSVNVGPVREDVLC